MYRKLSKAHDHTSVRARAPTGPDCLEVQCSCLHLQLPTRRGARLAKVPLGRAQVGKGPIREAKEAEPLKSLRASPEVSLLLQMRKRNLQKSPALRMPASQSALCCVSGQDLSLRTRPWPACAGLCFSRSFRGRGFYVLLFLSSHLLSQLSLQRETALSFPLDQSHLAWG